jgi:two-component system chemotaxis sensor kinase CheA
MVGIGADRVRQLFAQEADVRLAELGRLLLQLETHVDDETLVRSVYRELHTLKGSAAVAGLDDVSQVAHQLEELVEDVRAGRQPITPDVIDTLLRGADELSDAISGRSGDNGTTGADGADGNGSGARPPAERIEYAAPASPAGRATVTADSRTGVIMVPVERLEELTRLVGETASAHLRIGRMLNERFQIDPATCPEFNDLSRTLNDLHDRTMRTQMVPVSTITDQLHRAVRDLAHAQGKEIRWETVGADTELDRGVLHRLSGSLTHLVRNAVAHGIETPGEREAAGKPAQASLRLHAMQLGSDVIITVSDDGRGIDTAGVARAATRLGVDTDGLTDEDLLDLTFQPGLSTAHLVSDLSGRGVGLDEVRSSVEAAHGRVEARSEPGAGTEFRIIVPITVAVLRCLIVETSGQSYALPFHRVLLTQAHDAAGVVHAEGRPVVLVDGHPVPLSALDDALGVGRDEPPTGPVVVLADASRRHAFTTDRLVGQRDVVIKALSPLVPHLPVVAGASVEADGSILVVLDPPGLIQRARRSMRAGARGAGSAGTEHRRSILVVDDALIIRELQRGILERSGFDVRVATDGLHALALLAEARSDLVVTDIEMPRMDGFELTEAIRAHPALANIPVLIVSSRSSDADRQRGLDAGADGYIIKSAFDESSLLNAVNRLMGSHA